jgi:hypothetical protein
VADIDKELENIEQGEAWNESDEVVQIEVKQPLDKVIPVRLPAETWEQLRKEAKELGIGPTTLARMWIMERLRLQLISSPNNIIQKLFESAASQEDIDIQLTPREFEILTNISQGATLKEITENLNISEAAVKTHLKSIRHKLDPFTAITHKIEEYALVK